ncbi:MAG TPA: N-acetyl sugar amidotransferase [Bacteroidales bacterium]|nr:N-acetyl sugar amidotransferase [Bacteroidales bacterium]
MSLISPISYRQCTRCVMDSSDPDIVFDNKGKCNHCTDFDERIIKRTYRPGESEKSLLALVERIKHSGRGKAYDCVLGLSGGVDSCYAAWVASKQGLRLLAVHLDNGWDSAEATDNVMQVVDRLGLGYERVRPDAKEFRDLQLAFLRASVPEAETPTDIAIPAVLHRVAARHGIKYIISGGNYATEGILPESWHYNAKDLKYLKAIHRRFGSMPIRSFPLFAWQHETYYKFFKGIRMVYLLNYLPYNKAEAIELLQSELGWKPYGGKHYESNYTGWVQGVLLPQKFNIDYRRATFSSNICAGFMTRSKALELLKHPPMQQAKAQAQTLAVAEKLGIELRELQEILNARPLSHNNYPNQRKWLGFLYGVYRLLKG